MPYDLSGSKTSRTLALADLDGDGALDVVVQGLNGSGTLFSYLGRGDGTFTLRLTSPAPNSKRIAPLTLADVTADGDPDALTPSGLTLRTGSSFFPARAPACSGRLGWCRWRGTGPLPR